MVFPDAAAGKGLSCTVSITLAQQVVSETLLVAVEDLDKGMMIITTPS